MALIRARRQACKLQDMLMRRQGVATDSSGGAEHT